MLEHHVPSPVENAVTKFTPLITYPKDTSINEHIQKCDPNGPLIAYVTKLVDTKDASHFYAQVRVLSGTLKPSTSVKLLGESFTSDYDEDMKIQPVKKTFLSCARYRIGVNGLPAGSIGLISGHEIDLFITKTATIYDTKFSSSEMAIVRPLDQLSKPVFKVAVQPFKPSEFSKFVEGLKKLNRSYIGCEIKVEEGGEHVILGYGELYMDCLLHDLRHLYTNIDIKVSDPMTRFAETCLDSSVVKLSIASSNKKNSITVVADPMDPQIGKDIENGIVSITEPIRKLAKKFKHMYDWDSLAARSIWTFGPDALGASILCDDTLPDEVDKQRLNAVKDSINQGFRWATREGPLCDEPIRDCRFRIIDASISSNLLESNGGQIIQMVRKACHAAFMTATPRLLEPIYEVEVICTTFIVKELTNLLEKRRGGVLTDRPIEGTQLFKIVGFVPVIESVGLETDIRLFTQGQAMPQFV
ncbi:unnamed protein product [Ambrosiozyma monospora]|uniref:Unnamed protein product n=1 Tax=Ambrosiozyma monospora TaxID=43982 RepID=A0ACB5TB59_AMBMO|nr:unnamed protein product [Ambrosiozyma monospora]